MQIDLLAYFMAHAPTEIPEWFETESEAKIPMDPRHTQDFETLHADIKRLCLNWADDPSYDLDSIDSDTVKELSQRAQMTPADTEDTLKSFQRAYESFNTQKKNAETSSASNRFFQWRLYYGKQMLETHAQVPGIKYG